MTNRLMLLFSFFIATHLIWGQDKQNKTQPIFTVPDSSKKTREIHTFMNALYERGQFTGSILVAEHGHIIYENAFGMADREHNKPFTLSTPEYIGSITKPFTAMAIMILDERGKPTYDAPIRYFFPELPECMQPVTIRHLLYHTSGLSVFDDFPDMTERDVFNILLKQENLRFKPGEEFEYCNAGYSLLGMIIEKVSGQTLNDFLTSNIFKPLSMQNTSVNQITNRNVNRAIGYSIYGTQNNYDIFMGGNASMISTVEDLFKWDQALYKPKFIKQKTLQKAFSKSPITLKDDVYGYKSYGFGWWIGEYNGAKNVFHDGAFGGYRAYMERFLGERNTIIHISNLRHNLMMEIRIALVNILSDKPYVLPKVSISMWTCKQVRQVGIDNAIQMYHTLKNSSESKQYSFAESELNSLGYYLLRDNRIEEAIKIFLLNTEEYPQSANTYDSLGEGYMKAGNKELAIASYKKSLELNPDNDNAAQMIKNLDN